MLPRWMSPPSSQLLFNAACTTCIAAVDRAPANRAPSQDVGIAGGDVAPADSRHNVRGLSVELVRRDPETGKDMCSDVQP